MSAANEFNAAPKSATGSALRRCAANVIAAFVILFRPARAPARQSWLPAPQRLAILVAVFLVAFGIVMVFVDAAAFGAVKRLPGWLIAAFDWFTDFGKSGWFLFPLGTLFLILAAVPAHLTRMSQLVLAAVMVRIGFLFAAIGAPSLFATIVKRMIGRARPMVTGVLDPYAFVPFKWDSAYASLPSGHTTTAFAVLVAFGSLWPRARTIVLIYALLIAASRVVITAHFPSDVLAGALVGTIGALMVRRWFALRGLGFSVGPDGAMHRFSDPSLRRIKSVARELLAK
jgi:membrane-associated phospholipid phosphatase